MFQLGQPPYLRPGQSVVSRPSYTCPQLSSPQDKCLSKGDSLAVREVLAVPLGVPSVSPRATGYLLTIGRSHQGRSCSQGSSTKLPPPGHREVSGRPKVEVGPQRKGLVSTVPASFYNDRTTLHLGYPPYTLSPVSSPSDLLWKIMGCQCRAPLQQTQIH